MAKKLSTQRQDRLMENRFEFLLEDAKQREQCKKLINQIILDKECTFKPKFKKNANSPSRPYRNRKSIAHLSVGSYSHLTYNKAKDEQVKVISSEKKVSFEDVFHKLDKDSDGKIAAKDLLSTPLS
eukprot:TRINITY_DN15808_c0_g1_i3.p1 TRINITY_DN15808_c0_g1~~TRINITY_DN15808_c0_g1_i3.p1  ORF type:complete len:126 (-),score=13.11 TRINITY_DN15808_c0_g1_i3:444-821(-)